jgi:hypothetical protein
LTVANFRFVELQFVPIFELHTFDFLLVFVISQAEISLLGEVNQIGDTIDNQRSRGVKIARFGSFDLKPD